MHFPRRVNVMSNHLEENHLPVDSSALYSIANRKLVFELPLAGGLLPWACPFSVSGGVDSEFAFCGTSFSLDTTSDDLAMRVLRNPVASAPCNPVTLGSAWGSANALRTDAQCPGDRGQFWNNASCGNTLDTSSGEPSVAGSDVENAPTITSRPSVAGTV